VEDPRYLDLVTRGVLWATNHLNLDGTPATGYGRAGAAVKYLSHKDSGDGMFSRRAPSLFGTEHL
jgi:hypothetical protein